MTPFESAATAAKRKRYVRAIGPRLRRLLTVIFGLTAFLTANSVYLASVTFMEWVAKLKHQNVAYEKYFYQYMFLAHLVLGLLLVGPFVLFRHRAHLQHVQSPESPGAYALDICSLPLCLVLLGTGIALMQLEPFDVGRIRLALPPIKSPSVRSSLYWAHVIAPLFVVWLYVLHRLAGPKLKWRMA